MTSTPKFTPIPDRLADLKPPTRADAERFMSYRTNPAPPSRFEDTETGKRVAAGTNGYNSPAAAHEARKRWQDQRDAEVSDALVILTREYERDVAARQQIEASNAAALAAQKDGLRTAYLATGGTADEFERAYPALLEAVRARQMAANADAWERAAARARGI